MIVPSPPPESKHRPRRLPACRACGAHEGRAYVRGWSAGVRLLADALRRADLDEARELIDLAERKASEGRAA